MTENFVNVYNGQIIDANFDYSATIQQYPITDELLEKWEQDKESVIFMNGEVVENPDYIEIKPEERKAEFRRDFFQTSLGWIRRKVNMKTGEIKDFLTDLLPVISMSVLNGQVVNIITYREPDYTKDVTDWEELQTVKPATSNFIRECCLQVSKDFTGV